MQLSNECFQVLIDVQHVFEKPQVRKVHFHVLDGVRSLGLQVRVLYRLVGIDPSF